MSDFFRWFTAAGIFRGALFVSGDATGCRAPIGMGLWCCRPRENRRRQNLAVVIRQKSVRPRRDLSQEWKLKVQLKVRYGTPGPGKNGLKMSDGLKQGIGVCAAWRRLFAAKPGPKTIQLLAQFAPQPIHRFQDKRQSQRFSGGLERNSRQHLHQPLPHQRSRQGVPW